MRRARGDERLTDGKRRFWIGVAITLLGALFALPVYLLQGNSLADAAVTLASFGAFEWAIFLVGLVVIGTICGYGFYLHGVSIVGSVKGSLLGAIEPVSATVLAALWLGTAFTGYDVAGMVLMCIMVVCVTSDEDDASSDDDG